MAVVIEFETKEDRLKAIDFLAEADKSYQRVPHARFVLSNESARILRDRKVQFRVIGGEKEEDHYASCP